MDQSETTKPATSIEANRLGNFEQLGGRLKFQDSSKSNEPQYPAKEKRRLDRAQFLSLAEVEARYGVPFGTLQQLKPPFPQLVRIAGNSQPFFSRASIVRWDIELKRRKTSARREAR
jgi:hypothetical protein